jgi:FkbM family methyltransferase
LGNEHASWTVCPELLSDKDTIYSIGVGEDVSFDLELIRRFGVEVHAFDPTPRSIAWVGKQNLPAQFVFHEWGIADFDGTAFFAPPEILAHVSHTMVRKPSVNSGSPVNLPVQRLPTAMRNLGHDRIDLLKMDIEGAEYEVIADILSCGISIKQLLIEFHHRWAEIGLEKTKAAIRVLNHAGYRIFNISSSGQEYSFKKL